MPNGSEALDFEAVLKTTDFKRELASLKQEIRGFVNTTTTETKKIDNAFSNIAKVAAGAFAFTQLSDLPSKIIQVRGEFQNLEIAFTTMLKSKSAADKLLGEITQFAAKTPFTLTDVANGAKQLLAYGSSVKTVISEIRTLGDVSAGVSAPIGDLIYLYGTLRTQGRAYSVDIRQFASRGIPIYEELAKVLKINSSEVNNFVEAGKVGFKEVEQAFKNMTTNGGIFEGLTEKTSKSLTGLLSNFKDAVDRAFNDLGKSQEGLIATGITTATALVDNYQEVLDILTVLVVAYGSYRAAIIATNVIQSASALSGSISTWISLAGSIKSAADAQALFNLTTKANPYVLAIGVLTTLVTYLYLYRDETKKIVSANELLADANKTVNSQIKTQQTEINSLVSVLKNQGVAESQRLEAYEKLKSINPDIVKGLDFQKAKTADLTKEVNNYILALDKSLRLEANRGKLKEAVDQQIQAQEELTKAQEELNRTSKNNKGLAGINGATTGFNTNVGSFDDYTIALAKVSDAKKKFVDTSIEVNKIADANEKILTKSTKQQIQERVKDLELIQGSLNKLSPEYKKYEEQIKGLNKQLSESSAPTAKSFSQRLAEANDVGNLLLLKSHAKTENEIDALSKKIEEKKKDLNKTSSDYKKLQRAYNELNPKTSTKKPDEVYPFGSLKYWEDVSKKAEEALSKLSPDQTSKISKFQQEKLNADKQVEALRKQFTIRSFDEEIEYKKQQYELYNRWVEFEGQGAANASFTELIKQGNSFKAYLEGQILDIQAKIDAGTATAKDNENIVVLKSTLKVEDNTFEKYKESIYKAKMEVASLTDYIEILKEEQSKVTGKDELLFVSEEKIKAEKERMQLLKEFFIEANVNEQKVIAAQKYYTDLRLELDKQYADKKSQIYVDALAKINKEEADALKDLKLDEFFKKSKGFKELNKTVIGSEYKLVNKRIADLKTTIAEFEQAGLQNTEEYRQYLLALQQELLKLVNLQVGGFGELASIFGSISDDIGGLVGGIRDFAKGISNVSSGISNLASNVQKYGADAAGVLTIAKIIVDTINKTEQALSIKKDAEKAYYDTVKSQQFEYNKLLNDEIRLKSKVASSPYLTNYQGVVQDSINAQADALDKFNKSLSVLEEKGKAKDGTKSGIDLIKAAQTLIFGALFKNPADAFYTKDNLVSVFEKYPELIDKSKQGVDAFNISLAKSLLASNSLDDATKQMVENTIDWVEQYKAAQEQLQSVILDLTGQIGNDLRSALVTAFKEGTSAADAFGATVSNVLENIVSQTLFSAVFSKAFKNLKDDFEESFSATGDGKITDDLVDFYKDYPDLVKVFTDGLSDAKKEAEKAGLDIFKNTTTGTSSGLSGAIKGITEETAGLLAGQFNAIRITGANHLQVSRDSLLQLTTIANNSRYLQKLESIDNKLGKSSIDDLRAGGL